MSCVPCLGWSPGQPGCSGCTGLGTPLSDIGAYTVYWALSIVLPGTLVHRAIRGSRGNLPEDLGYGAVVGLVLEMVAWAVSAAVGGQSLLRWWAAPVVLVFLAVPPFAGIGGSPIRSRCPSGGPG